MADPSPTAAEPGQEPAEPEGQEPAGETPPTETPDEPGGRTYSESYVKQLRKEAAAARNEKQRLEEQVQEYSDRDKSELEKLNARAETAERKANESELRLLRFEVAAEHGLDLDSAKFLSGSTREEIELRAEELQKLLVDKGRPGSTARFDGGARQPVAEQKSPEEAHQDFLLRSLGHRT